MGEESHEHGISRRSFVTGVIGVLGGIISAIVGLPAIGYLISPALKRESADEWVPLGFVEDIPEGEPTLFAFTRTKEVGWERTAFSYGVYVVRKADGELDVFSNVCTHVGCRVSWNEDLAAYVCPCHNGHFARDGAIISGPVPRPLDRYDYRVAEDGRLMIHLQEG